VKRSADQEFARPERAALSRRAPVYAGALVLTAEFQPRDETRRSPDRVARQLLGRREDPHHGLQALRKERRVRPVDQFIAVYVDELRQLTER
jgi:hypothetical protein